MDIAAGAPLLQRVVTVVLLYLVMGFALTNAFAFLHIGHGFRKAVCGLPDRDFFALAKQGALRGVRRSFFGKLVHCHACLGFWIGCLLSLAHGGFIVEYMKVGSTVEAVVMDGLLLSGFNFILWVILVRLGAEEL